jgi:MFS transporter, ACS family, D-galactonate transporter
VGPLFVLALVNFLDRIVMSIAAPAIMKEFHLSETQMGTVFSAFGVTYLALMIPGGILRTFLAHG